MQQEEHEEIKVLSHEAWPGFKKGFLITFALLSIYLIVIILSAPNGGSPGLHHH